jgi:hypothetical protein
LVRLGCLATTVTPVPLMPQIKETMIAAERSQRLLVILISQLGIE